VFAKSNILLQDEVLLVALKFYLIDIGVVVKFNFLFLMFFIEIRKLLLLNEANSL